MYNIQIKLIVLTHSVCPYKNYGLKYFINAALKLSPHGKESTAISVCTRAFYAHTNRLIIEAVYARAC